MYAYQVALNMGGEIIETHLDSNPFATGTHNLAGTTTGTLVNPGADFKSCGVQAGVLIKNTTTGEDGLITAVRENEIDATGYLKDANDEIIYDIDGDPLTVDLDWNYGDTYEIYLTSTENSIITSRYTDKRYGTRTKIPLDRGLFEDDVDVDEYERNVFGPDQPSIPSY